jgi:hypothetical protein
MGEWGEAGFSGGGWHSEGVKVILRTGRTTRPTIPLPHLSIVFILVLSLGWCPVVRQTKWRCVFVTSSHRLADGFFVFINIVKCITVAVDVVHALGRAGVGWLLPTPSLEPLPVQSLPLLLLLTDHLVQHGLHFVSTGRQGKALIETGISTGHGSRAWLGFWADP